MTDRPGAELSDDGSYYRVPVYEAMERRAGRERRLEAALCEIDAFGHNNPGRGWSCAEKARAARADD